MYDKAQVLQMVRQQMGGIEALVNSVGQHENSAQRQIEGAISFWQQVIALAYDGELTLSDRAVAERELVRRRAELHARLNMVPLPEHGKAV